MKTYEDQLNQMIPDVTDLLNTLILYKLAARFLKKHEIDMILEEGKKSIYSEFTKHLEDTTTNKNILSKILTDVEANIKDTISSMRAIDHDDMGNYNQSPFPAASQG